MVYFRPLFQITSQVGSILCAMYETSLKQFTTVYSSLWFISRYGHNRFTVRLSSPCRGWSAARLIVVHEREVVDASCLISGERLLESIGKLIELATKCFRWNLIGVSSACPVSYCPVGVALTWYFVVNLVLFTVWVTAFSLPFPSHALSTPSSVTPGCILSVSHSTSPRRVVKRSLKAIVVNVAMSHQWASVNFIFERRQRCLDRRNWANACWVVQLVAERTLARLNVRILERWRVVFS